MQRIGFWPGFSLGWYRIGLCPNQNSLMRNRDPYLAKVLRFSGVFRVSISSMTGVALFLALSSLMVRMYSIIILEYSGHSFHRQMVSACIIFHFYSYLYKCKSFGFFCAPVCGPIAGDRQNRLEVPAVAK